jgi:CubicO group peptidase (beta-lactamase class C family)
MRPATQLQVASISKPVAALTVLRLARSGVVDLDGPVEAHTGGWRIPTSGPDAGGVTLRRLLSHTAGIDVDGYPGIPPGTPLPDTRGSLAGASGGGTARLVRRPGSAWRYSGGGYTIAQLAVEEATGEPFPAVAAREVLEPLGMRDTDFACTTSDDPGPRVARGHDPDGRPLPTFRFSDHAAAGLCSTAGDLGRLAAALMTGPEGTAMGAPAPGARGSYGLGLSTQELRDGSRRIWHDGSNPGFRGRMEAHPASGWGLVVLTNGDNGSRVLEDVTRLVVR